MLTANPSAAVVAACYGVRGQNPPVERQCKKKTANVHIASTAKTRHSMEKHLNQAFPSNRPFGGCFRHHEPGDLDMHRLSPDETAGNAGHATVKRISVQRPALTRQKRLMQETQKGYVTKLARENQLSER